MPGLVEEIAPEPAPVAVAVIAPSFQISKQKVSLDVDPVTRRIEGKSEIDFTPLTESLETITLHCRQAYITRVVWSPSPIPCSFTYDDPYEALDINFTTTAHQHEQLKSRLPTDPDETTIEIRKPKSILVKEKQQAVAASNDGKKKGVSEKTYETMRITIKFVVQNARDGLHYVGWDLEDLRYPHVFTQTTGTAAIASLFPCLDSINEKYQWELSITTPQTIGDALSRHASDSKSLANQKLQSMNEADKALELKVVCSGEMTENSKDDALGTQTCSFALENLVTARHIGFAIGPFEEINLAAFRESDEDDRLGKNAVPIHAFCLPSRTAQVKNTCFPIAKAMDYFAVDYTQYPFTSFKMCFVDDLLVDHHDTASLSICSNNMLFGDDIIDPLYSTTRKLVFALASQWSGINLTAEAPADFWVVIGIAYFMADSFLKTVFGNNEYRYQQKIAATKVVEQDIGVPSLGVCGKFVALDRYYYDFIALKAPVVLFILDRRLNKLNASYGLTRMIGKAMRDNSDGKLSSNAFHKLCERAGHTKLQSFFDQWVYGSGCPSFTVVQRFNKKKLVVEMQIEQNQSKRELNAIIQAQNFIREVKEHSKDVFVEEQPCFVGPMTIRIHEADGTPYEHIVEIKEPRVKFEIPYNTKYKRLKRSRRQREKIVVGNTGDDATGEGADDVLLYCLGDILQSEEDYKDWKLENFSQDDIDKMGQESYEWIRMDADFEWICSLSINMPGYMFVSQLQQDRDVVAQLDTVNYMAGHKPNPLICTFLIRTLMDERYFYGVRTAAAHALRAHSRGPRGAIGFYQLQKAFQEFFCLQDTKMTRPNDFSDRATYLVQLAIVIAMSGVRADDGRAPYKIRRFLYEVLHYNDNGENEYSDCFYIAALIKGLAEAVASAPLDERLSIETGDDYDFLKSCWNEIERYQRRDGWIPSYQNIVSTTALYAKYCLDKAGCVPKIHTEYLYMSQPGNHEDIRVAALSYLFDLGLGFSAPFLTYFFSTYVSESSPRTRARMMHILNKFIGAVAIGDYSQPNEPIADTQDGLLIEQDTGTGERQAGIARKETVEGALKGLKQDLGDNTAFMAGIWGAVLSSRISLEEFSDLLTLCSWLYTAKNSVMVTVNYPREVRFDNWRTIKQPGQKPKVLLTLDLEGPIRTTKRVKLSQPKPGISTASTPAQVKTALVTPKQVPAPPPPAVVNRPSTKITLKTGSIKIPGKRNSGITGSTKPNAGLPTQAKTNTIPASTSQINPTTSTSRPNSIAIPPPIATTGSPQTGGSTTAAVVTPSTGGFKLKLKYTAKPKVNGVNGTNGGAGGA